VSQSPLRREEPGEPEPEQPGEVEGLTALAQNSNKDFLHDFSTIMSTEQRTKYKAVYSESYTKYLELHKVLESITQKAAALEEQLKRTTRGSPQFKEVKLKIKEEFLRTKTDPGCQEAYSSFQYLHEKLGHIKKLVHNYDQERLGRR
jgi:RNA polymerase II elongation factor ELL